MKSTWRMCPKGHRYYKTSECPTCPVCEEKRKPASGFLSMLGAPARRALEQAGVTTLKQLSRCHEHQILALHGMGPSSVTKLRKALAAEGLAFKS